MESEGDLIMKIIDAHVHLVQTIAGFSSMGEIRACGKGCGIDAMGNVFPMLPPEIGECNAAPEAVLKIMDAHNVEKAVLLQGTYFGFQNQYTYEAMRRYPGRFAAAASYDPFCGQKDAIRTHLFDELGFKIVKFEVSSRCGLSGYHTDIDLDGEIMHDVYRHAAERNLTFVIDIGRPGTKSWQIDALCSAIRRYPEMKFVICHLAAPHPGEDKLVRSVLGKLSLDNVWFDLAALCANSRPEVYPYPSALRYIRYAIDIAGPDRLLWGSDLPSTMVRDSYQDQIDFIALSEAFTKTEKAKIFYENADHVYFGTLY